MSLSDTDEPSDGAAGLMSPRKDELVTREREAIARMLKSHLQEQAGGGAESPTGGSPRAALLAAANSIESEAAAAQQQGQGSSVRRRQHNAGFDDIRAALKRLQQSSKQAAQIRKIDKTRTLVATGARDPNTVKKLADEVEHSYVALSQREEDIRCVSSHDRCCVSFFCFACCSCNAFVVLC